ncbi:MULTISPECIES: hypothetical protein [unclassified Beijerinckia]|uniref:hypothetical protein n=1 Tax=unclassified Beijerinckia TaxID=2638183 RepID=UPI000898F1B2|nr:MULTISPECIES: hypothetical protein [unclassified Beijerinckia]MDH7795729.1 hypothetical protein [Beijerinckia sp. GAS462]SEC13701.1 hypothetical protein SAMN05443249_2006 [Beijerinckia sp. 28-YEA-48]
MISRIAIAIGAGLAAALLFYIPVKGSALAMILAIFAALPIMIAGLAFSPSVAFGAAFAGTAALLLALDEIFAATFALTAAFPAWWLTRLAWLARPAANGESGATPDGLVWYPLGQLLAWITALAAAMSIAGILMAWYRFGSYDAFLEEASRRMQPLIEAIFSRGGSSLPAGLDAEGLARVFVLAMTPIFAAWTVATTALNLWLAGRVARMSERGRPWVNVPENLVLPRTTLYALGAGVILLLPEGFLRIGGYVILASISIALVLQGLASLHYASRPSRVRSTMLTLLYVSMFILFPLPLPLLAVVGLVDMLMSIRKRSNIPPASGAQTT